MGYYTQYELVKYPEIKPPKVKFKCKCGAEIDTKYCPNCGNPSIKIPSSLNDWEVYISMRFCGGWPYLFEESAKWYSHEADIRQLSTEFDGVFEIHGEGEEQGDVWRFYAKNGKTKTITPVLTWPEFNEGQLKD